MATNPLVTQGTLNRLRCSIVVPSFTTLNITSSYMGKNFATITFDEGPFADQIETAVGVVISPEPYVMANVSVGILRTQGLANSWLTQAQATSSIGSIIVYPDTSAFPSIEIDSAVIKTLDPGAYDGKDPVVKLLIRGIFFINNNLWNLT